MGFYLQPPTLHRKADYLIAHHGAQLIFDPVFHAGEFTTVCVVDNGPFEAAGIAYSEEELAAFATPTIRPRIWLKVPTAEIKIMCPKVAPHLK